MNAPAHHGGVPHDAIVPADRFIDAGGQGTYTIKELLAVFRRRRRLFLVVSTLLLVAALGIAFGLPPVYRASATILIEQPQVPEELVRSTITSYADERIQVISQRVMTSANLVEIINRYDLYADERETEPMESTVARMTKDIDMERVSAEVVDPRSGRSIEATIAFNVSFDSSVPELAQSVAGELASLYLNENVKSRTQVAADASGFLSREAQRLNDEIAAIETRIAAFKEQNAGRLPELMELNLQLMDRTERELAEAERQIRSLQEQAILLRSDMAQVPTNSVAYSATGRPLAGPHEQLSLVEAEYLSKSAVYSADHPDLVRLRKEMTALQGQLNGSTGESVLERELAAKRAELATAMRRYSEAHPDVKRLRQSVLRLETELETAPSTTRAPASPAQTLNPAYIELQARAKAAETELQTWTVKREELRAKLNEYEQRLTQTPQVEREYRALLRDHENALEKYQEIKTKETEARLGETLELERKGERFVLLEPPAYPETPVKPNRLLILALGGVFALGGGLGAVAVAESTDESVRGRHAVQRLLGAPPLAVIPYIENPADVRARTLKRLLAVTGVVAALAGAAWYVHSTVHPLHVLWYAMLSRFGA